MNHQGTKTRRVDGSRLLVRAPIVPVPVPDLVFAKKSGFSWSGSIRTLVYVNVYRFAVNVYGLTPNIRNSAAPPRESSCISTAPAQRASTAFNSTFKIQHSKFGGGAAAPCLRENPNFFVPWCLGGSTPLSIAECGLRISD